MAKEALKYVPEEEKEGPVEPGEERSQEVFSGEIDTDENEAKRSSRDISEIKDQKRRKYILEEINRYRKEISSKKRRGEEARKRGDFTMSALGILEKQIDFDKFVNTLSYKEIEDHRDLIEQIRQM